MKIKIKFILIIFYIQFLVLVTSLKSYSTDQERIIFKKSNFRMYNTTQNNDDDIEIDPPQLMLKLIIVYFEFFLIFSVISYHKWWEELWFMKRYSIKTRHQTIRDLSKTEDSISRYNGKYVYISGPTRIVKTAEHELLKLNNGIKFSKIKAKVQILNPDSLIWESLKEERIYTDINYVPTNDVADISILNDKYIEYSHMGNIFTFPRFFLKNCIGEVEIRGISLSHQQIKKLKEKKRINLKNKNINEELFKVMGTEIKWSIKDDHIYIDNMDEGDSKCQMRVCFYGYSGSEVSILARLQNNRFKTINIPYKFGEENKMDDSKEINMSTDMITESSISIDLCNLIFCFCLSGAPSYHEKNVEEYHNQTKINWIIEGTYSFEHFLNKKYEISNLNIAIARILFFLFFLIFFSLLPEPLQILYKFTFRVDKEKIMENLIKYNLIMSGAIITATFLISKFSYLTRHVIISIFLIILIMIFIIFTIREILLLD